MTCGRRPLAPPCYHKNMSTKAECGHLVIDEHGQCENCSEYVGPEGPRQAAASQPYHEATPEEVRAEAARLNARWEALCARLDERIIRKALS